MPVKQRKKTASIPTIFLFVIGLFFLCLSIGWNVYQGRVLSFSSPPTVSQEETKTKASPPTRILIAKFGIDLPVVESQIKNGVWEINPKGGSHLASSAAPSEGGNIILYGHNKKKLFGKVLGIKKGDEIKIITADNKEYIYTVFDTKTVKPTDTSVLLPTTEEILTFYTCTGFLDTKRFIVTAKKS